MYCVKIGSDNRVQYVAQCFKKLPTGALPIESYPTENPITDYLYLNNSFVYDPAPVVKSETSAESKPTTDDRLDAIEAAIMDIASTMYRDETEESDIEEDTNG